MTIAQVKRVVGAGDYQRRNIEAILKFDLFGSNVGWRIINVARKYITIERADRTVRIEASVITELVVGL